MDDILYRQFQALEREHWWFVARREILLAVLRQHARVGGRFLDVGCGTGYLLERVRESFDAWGIDASPIALAMCRERGLDRVALGSAEDLAGVGEERFDAAGLFDVIEHLDDDVAALRNVHGVLVPGGVVVVTVPAYMFMWSKHDVVNQHRRRYVRGQLGRVLAAAGFRVEKLTYFNTRLFPAAFVTRMAKRVTGAQESDFSLPSPRVNRLLTRTFAGEAARVLKARTAGGFPFGLSILAVGRRV